MTPPPGSVPALWHDDSLLADLVQENTQLKEEIRRMRAGVPSVTRNDIPTASSAGVVCHICGAPATCIGNYEGANWHGPTAACDACCGHGNEDGWCEPIAPDAAERES